MTFRLTLILLFKLSGLVLFGQQVDSCGMDNSPFLNNYEAEYFNKIFENKRMDFDFKEKKVGFFFGPNGQHLGCKLKYFNEVKEHINPQNYFVKLSESEKQDSGGYEVIVVTWSKIYKKKPTNKMVMSLKKDKIEFSECTN
jgi:hypothetical protein